MSEVKDMVKIITDALSEKKAEDIKIIDISEISTIADYYIITDGANPNQVHALVDFVDEKMSKAGYQARSTEGYRNANWVLIDYNDVIVNVFSKEDRRFFDLERIWRDGKAIEDLSDIK